MRFLVFMYRFPYKVTSNYNQIFITKVLLSMLEIKFISIVGMFEIDEIFLITNGWSNLDIDFLDANSITRK